MSGPKYSRPRLTAAQRRRQEEERKRRMEEERRRQEERKLKEMDQKIEKLYPKLNNMKQTIEGFGVSAIDEARHVLGEHPVIDSFLTKKQQSLSKINRFPSKYEKRTLPAVQAYQKNLEQLISTSRQYFENELALTCEELQSIIKEKKVIDAEKSFINRSRHLEIKSQTNIDLSLSHSKDDESETLLLQQQWDLFNELILPYIESNYLQKKNIEEIKALYSRTESIFKDEKWDKKYRYAQIDQRLKAFLTTKSKYDREIGVFNQLEQEFEFLLISYQTLCEMLDKETVKHPFSIQDGPSQVEALKEDISTLEKQLREKEETEYIANSVNEIMTSLGYEVVSSDIMQTPKRRVVQQLYDFGEDSVINVSASDDGSLLFQVAGISEGPKREASSLEKVRMMENMEKFCEKYPVIREKLLTKGIELTNEDLKPTCEEYVSFIDLSKRKNVRRANQKKQVNQKGDLHKKMFE
ncbi:hypothetical protein [Niallia endozanthoxylica]|uniref:Uncharacterized protein n=1 Tax=Niallia endozanthoxylica TaxID=2036016 RepID=A0A5J5HQ76_9BACI|nr:hypothetical protein [Niallia endozanthoxylica]KAA9023913.1 hypothetical protein F4V44_12310 [Niallia endozanthoxylica]